MILELIAGIIVLYLLYIYYTIRQTAVDPGECLSLVSALSIEIYINIYI
jgi:hypothetical protein